MRDKVQKSANVILYLDNIPVAGQLGAVLNQSAQTIDISNQIETDWAEYLVGTKNWSINCNGIYVISANSLLALEEAFINNTELTTVIKIDKNLNLRGQALIVDFPLNATYNDQFKYTLKLLGTGPLQKYDSV